MDDLKKKTESELSKLLSEKQAALRSFRFAISGSKTKNVKEGAKLHKDIARVLTELSARRAAVTL